jgi:hypothetical protein
MANLAKFGIPLDGNKLGILHPKQKYRFRVVWQNFGENNGLREMTANVVTCTRPKITYNEVQLDSYNSVAWIQGKHTYDPIEITLRDDITNAVVSSIGAQVQKQMNHFEQTSAVAGINYKFSMEVHSLDGTDNEQLESWVLDGCWIQAAAYGDSDYASGDPNIVTFKILSFTPKHVWGQKTHDGTTVGGNPYPNIASPTGGTTFA